MTHKIVIFLLLFSVCAAICFALWRFLADVDHEDIFGEVSASDIATASQAMMWALRSDPRYKWVELRAKPGDTDTLLVVRHTKPKSP